MRVLSVVGTRPQFVKLGPVDGALSASGIDHVIVHTGQHHHEWLSDAFYRELGLPAPDDHLAVGSGSHGAQTARMLEACERSVQEHRPDVVVNYGDTNSTLAGTLAAAKLRIPTVHVEAGVRSFDRSMPEEINRLAVDHVSTSCLAPTQTAMDNLAAEGLGDRATLVGDVMIDVLLRTHATVTDADVAAEVDPEAGYVLATLHRPENADHPERLASIIDALASFDTPVLFPAHPRVLDQAERHRVRLDRGSVIVVAPLSYRSLIATLAHARAVITDSGGLQKEAHDLGVPCTTVRASTEWPETLVGGSNVLCPDPGTLGDVAFRDVAVTPPPAVPEAAPLVVRAIRDLVES